MAQDAVRLEGLARVPIHAHLVDGSDAEQLVNVITQLPDSVAAVVIARTDAERARWVQRRMGQRSGLMVLSDEDLNAIALAAAATAYVQRIGRDPREARVLIAGAVGMPILTPLLLGIGFPDITMWNVVDGIRFPLARAARDADVVLDVLPAATGAAGLVMDRPEGSVLGRGSDDDGGYLAAPGLLQAVVDYPSGTFVHGVDLLVTCARAAASAFPRRCQKLSDFVSDRGITAAIASALDHAARPPAPERRTSGQSRGSGHG